MRRGRYDHRARGTISPLRVIAAVVGTFVTGALIIVLPAKALVAGLAVLGCCGSVGLLLLRGSRFAPQRFVAAIVLWFFVFAPLVQLGSQRFSPYHLEDAELSFVAAAFLTGLFGLGYLLGLKVVRPSTQATGTLEHLPVRRTRAFVVFFIVAGVGAWAAYLGAMGGVVAFLTNVQNRTQLSAGLGYLFLLANLLQVGVLVAAVMDAAGQPVLPRWITVCGVFLATAIVLGMGMRSRALMLVAAVVLTSALIGLRIGYARLASLAIAGIIVIYAVGKLRTLGTGSGAILEQSSVVAAVTADRESFLDSALIDYGHFDRLALVYEYFPRRVGYELGSTIGAVLLVPVPRSFYPEKPVGAGPVLANALRPGAWDLESGWTSGGTPTIMGELYMNFSWYGVPLGGLLAGIASALAYRRWVARRRTALDLLQYAIFVVFILLAGMLGELYGTLIMYAVFSLPLALLSRSCRTPVRASASIQVVAR